MKIVGGTRSTITFDLREWFLKAQGELLINKIELFIKIVTQWEPPQNLPGITQREMENIINTA